MSSVSRDTVAATLPDGLCADSTSVGNPVLFLLQISAWRHTVAAAGQSRQRATPASRQARRTHHFGAEAELATSLPHAVLGARQHCSRAA